MTFPVVASGASANNIFASPVSVSFGAALAAGDVAMAFIAASGTGADTITFPAGWTSASIQNTTNPVRPHLVVGYKVCDGSEGSSISVTVTNNNNQAQSVCWIAYRLTGAKAVEVSAGTQFDSGAPPNSASLTPSWGAKDTLWFSAEANENAPTGGAVPAGYGNTDEAIGLFNGVTGNDAASSLRVARRQLNATSDDPGAFAATGKRWAAFTVAVQPAEAFAAVSVVIV